MTKPLTPDICVIGAGPGGIAVAAAAASAGASVALVEPCFADGGSPDNLVLAAQALTAAARQAAAMRSAQKFGIAAAEPEIDFRAVMQHVRTVVAAAAPDASAERLVALGVTVIRQAARFKNARTLVAGDTEIRARHFVIAPATSPLTPPIPGLDGVDHLTEATAFDLTRRPGHLLVVGGGPAALQLAQAFCRLGSRVTLAEPGAALGEHDPEMAAVVLRRLRSEGVTVLEHATVTAAERRGKTGLRLLVETPAGAATLDGTHILVAAGRACDLDALDPGKARIVLDGRQVRVDASLRTRNRRIHAIGAAVGVPSEHLARHHAELVVRTILFKQKASISRAIIPRVAFTDPELAHVGLTEAEAAKAHKTIRILRWPYAENDRACAEHATEGHIKLVVDGAGKIIGATIVGDRASELIGLWTLALSKDLSLGDVAGSVPAYPTMGEIGKHAAMTYFAGAARKPLLRRIVGLLRPFGLGRHNDGKA